MIRRSPSWARVGRMCVHGVFYIKNRFIRFYKNRFGCFSLSQMHSFQYKLCYTADDDIISNWVEIMARWPNISQKIWKVSVENSQLLVRLVIELSGLHENIFTHLHTSGLISGVEYMCLPTILTLLCVYACRELFITNSNWIWNQFGRITLNLLTVRRTLIWRELLNCISMANDG